MTKSWHSLIFLLVAPGMLFTSVLENQQISIVKNTASIIFPRYIKFQLDATSHNTIQKVTLIYGIDRLSCQPAVSRQTINFTPGQQVSLEWELEFARSGMIPPGAEIWWQWEISGDQGFLSQTEKKSITIQDERFEWHRLDREGISVQWHQGSLSFGEAIFQIAEKNLHRLSSQMDIQPPRKIWITVYASTEEMRVALVRSDNWVGAVALPDYGSILLGLAPEDLNVADYYISHELTHLVIGELTFNCMGVELPTWLNEGIAENAQGEPDQDDLDAIILAIESQNLPELNEIAGGFSADVDQARLAYIQSNLVVKYLLETYGSSKMSSLLAAFQSGLIADEALQEVYGIDAAGIDSEWRQSLGFSMATATPVKKPARTPVPTLSLWTVAVPPTGEPATPPSPIPTRTVAPVFSPAPPTSTLTNIPSGLIDDSPEPSPIPPCPGLFIVPTILCLFLIRRKECVS